MKYKKLIKPTLLTCVLLISTLLLFVKTNINVFNTIFLFIHAHLYSLAFYRWMLITAIFIFWEKILNLLSKHFEINEVSLNSWKNVRWSVTIWLIIFELLINENLILIFF